MGLQKRMDKTEVKILDDRQLSASASQKSARRTQTLPSAEKAEELFR
jgi:hypothetical protein